jgi:hypothetical protein
VPVLNTYADPLNRNWLKIQSAIRECHWSDVEKLSAWAFICPVEAVEGKAIDLEKYPIVETKRPIASTGFEPCLPFESYPGGGRKLLGHVKGANCRHEYGLQFMKVTGQTKCAYCSMDFTESYDNWLQMALDHVVPSGVGKAKGIDKDGCTNWLDDSSSKVLACATCNTLDNRHALTDSEFCPSSVEDYFDLRDRVFSRRKTIVWRKRLAERRFFEGNVFNLLFSEQ